MCKERMKFWNAHNFHTVQQNIDKNKIYQYRFFSPQPFSRLATTNIESTIYLGTFLLKYISHVLINVNLNYLNASWIGTQTLN